MATHSPNTPSGVAATGLPAEPQLIETCVCPPVYADGLALVEFAPSGNARLTLYVDQRDTFEGHLDRTVAARLVIPRAALMEAVAKIMAAQHDVPEPGWASRTAGGRA